MSPRWGNNNAHLLFFHLQSTTHMPLCQTGESPPCCHYLLYVACYAYWLQKILQTHQNLPTSDVEVCQHNCLRLHFCSTQVISTVIKNSCQMFVSSTAVYNNNNNFNGHQSTKLGEPVPEKKHSTTQVLSSWSLSNVFNSNQIINYTENGKHITNITKAYQHLCNNTSE